MSLQKAIDHLERAEIHLRHAARNGGSLKIDLNALRATISNLKKKESICHEEKPQQHPAGSLHHLGLRTVLPLCGTASSVPAEDDAADPAAG